MPACSECLNDPNYHKHNVSENCHKSTRKTLEDLEKLINGDIP